MTYPGACVVLSPVPADPNRHCWYAVGLARAKGGGWSVTVAVEKPSRAEAEIASLGMIRQWGDVGVVTLDHEIQMGEVLTREQVGR